jgi:hypothetical protein
MVLLGLVVVVVWSGGLGGGLTPSCWIADRAARGAPAVVVGAHAVLLADLGAAELLRQLPDALLQVLTHGDLLLPAGRAISSPAPGDRVAAGHDTAGRVNGGRLRPSRRDAKRR